MQLTPTSVDGKERYDAKASFCEVDWDLQRENPASVSFFSGLKEQSTSCDSTMHTFDLFDIVQKIRSYDAITPNMRSIAPSGVIFHESRCGSTLAANILAASAPSKTRVYSEHYVPVDTLRACAESSACNDDLHMQLIRDVYYVLGRAPADYGLEFVFYKSNSGGMYIDKFTSAFPDAPWAYMFRDTHEIMQSHWKVPEESMDPDAHEAKCARLYRNPHQPEPTKAVLAKADKQYYELSQTEYCAAHLAGISHSVIQEHERTGKGRFINYQQMPQVMWETLLPIDFGVEVEPYMVDNMMQFTHLYAKGHQQGRANEKWASDTSQKKNSITENVSRAIELFCPNMYQQLERISQKQQREPKTWMVRKEARSS